MEKFWHAEANEPVMFPHPEDPFNVFYRVEMVDGKLTIDMWDSLSREPRRQISIEQVNPSKIAITS